jgi:3-methyladenine DNA glycosylase Tag
MVYVRVSTIKGRLSFFGPTSVYAFMQNVGMVNDRIHGCFRASDYRPTGSTNRSINR